VKWDAPAYRLDTTEQYETIDEAIAAALADLEPGGRLDIHAEDCESEDGETGCTCEPLRLTKGAEA
jgi:hypothetical protein